MIKLSKRMQALADMVTPGNILADIGTDHGFIPIALVRQQVIDRAIAMDVHQGPLQRAREHITREHLQDVIETRLSDGLEKLNPGEADTVLIAGMGGGIILHILKEHGEVAKSVREFILQPQSEQYEVRKFLWENEYSIMQENMICEDGKFYSMMRVVQKRDNSCQDTRMSKCQLTYGPCLLADRHPVLKQFLQREQHTKKEVLDTLEDIPQKNQKVLERIQELHHELAMIEEGLNICG